MVFLDTNVLVYAVDFRDERKQKIAAQIVEDALSGCREFAISVQTLSEFANVSLSKLKKSEAEVADLMRVFMDIPTVVPDGAIVMRALEIRRRSGIQFYDAMMLAAAEKAGAQTLYSEDLNDGQIYGSIRAENPFKA